MRHLRLLILLPPGLARPGQPARNLPPHDGHIAHAALDAALPRPRHHQGDGRPKHQAEGDARPEEHDAPQDGQDLQDDDGEEHEHGGGHHVGRAREDGREAVEGGREEGGEEDEEVVEACAEGLEGARGREEGGLEVREVEEGFGREDVWFWGGSG